MEMHSAFDSQVIEILIRLGYFQEFGSAGKLLRLYKEFREGEFRFSKAHIPATRDRRLSILRKLEREMAEESIPIRERLRFEIEMCGTAITTDASLRDVYAVLEIDDRYSPKLRLYSVATGRTGVMKLKKAIYNAQPLSAGDALRLLAWEQRPSYRYLNGRARPDYEHKELWISKYEKLL